VKLRDVTEKDTPPIFEIVIGWEAVAVPTVPEPKLRLSGVDEIAAVAGCPVRRDIQSELDVHVGLTVQT
jgi:hypothetical protein